MLRDTAELLSSNESLFETHIIKITLDLDLLRVIVKLRHFPVTAYAWYHSTIAVKFILFYCVPYLEFVFISCDKITRIIFVLPVDLHY